MDPSSIDAKRLHDLKKGKLTDMRFLVGPSSGTIKEVFACQVHVVSSIKSLRKLIDEDKSKKQTYTILKIRSIRVEFDDDESFTLLIEFLMLSGRLVTEVETLNQCMRLAVTARSFELDELGDYCKGLLLEKFLTVDNYWHTFNNHHGHSPAVYEAMQQFYLKNSKTLLMGHKLCRISEKALSSFLQFPDLQVDSEMDLVMICVFYAMSIGKLKARELFRRVALPYLRLYTLDDTSDAIKLMDFLELHESQKLIASLSPGGLKRLLEPVLYNQGTPVQFSVQTTSRKRKTTVQVKFLPRKPVKLIRLLYERSWATSWNIDFYLSKAQTKFELRFKAPRDLTIVALETMQPMHLSHFNVQDVFECFTCNQSKYRMQRPAFVRIGGSKLMELDEKDDWPSYTWDTWRASVAVKKDTQVTIEVFFDKHCLFRKERMTSRKSYHEIPFVLSMYEKESVESEWKEALDTDVNVIKSIFFYD